MESEKPRGIAILTARTVAADTFILTRSLSGSFSASSSVPIRAPLTVDDSDYSDDSCSVTEEHNLAISEASSSYSKGLDSGTDDDFESDSVEVDDETELEDVNRILEEDLGGETAGGSETSVNYSSLEEESEISDDEVGKVSEADRVSMKAKVVIPRAIISLDDDEFDEILGSDAEEDPLLCVSKAPGYKETEIKDMGLQFGEKGGVIDEPECSHSFSGECVSTEEDEVVGMNYSDKFDNDEQNLKKMVVQRTIIKEDDRDSNHEFDTLMKLGDVEGVEDSAVGLGEMGMTDKPEYSSSATCELVSTEEDMVQEKCSDDDVLMGDCKEFLLKSEGNVVDVDRGLDETLSQLVKHVVGQESDKRIGDGTSCEADELVTPAEGCIGLGSRESGDEDTGNLIHEAKDHGEDNCDAGNEIEKLECEDNPEVVVGADAIVSECGCSDQKAEQESENEDKSPSLSFFFETANETVENGEHISELINKQVNLQFDSEPDNSSVCIEETSLLSVTDLERTMPESSSAIAYDVTENETHMAQLIHNHSFMELDEYVERSDGREKRSYSEELLSSGHHLQLISEKVKERVEKTQLLKEKLQRLIRTGFCNENSTVTEVVPKMSVAGAEHKTSLGRKMMLSEQDGLEDLDLSINVLMIGKTGVGKSATVNSIFGETKSPVGAFGVTTKSANHVVGKVGGILVRILDTPGLMSSATEEQFNQEVFMSIKKSMKMFPVDVILYIGRLDEPPDIYLLRIITTSLGSSVWAKTIVVLTHAASNVPDSSSYKDFIAQRSSIMHQAIRQTVPELRKMPRIFLAENNISSFSGNKTTFPNWRLNLLILCCSIKIQSKANEKTGVFGSSQLRSFTLFCSLWNVFLLGSNTGNHDGLEEEKKKRYLLDSYPEILRDEQSQETLLLENQEPQERTGIGRVRTRRGRLGFQASKRFGIYLDTSGVSIGNGGCRKHEEEEEEKGRILVKMSVLGLVPILMSVFNSVYARKDT